MDHVRVAIQILKHLSMAAQVVLSQVGLKLKAASAAAVVPAYSLEAAAASGGASGGSWSSSGCAGGGGSYNAGTNQDNSSGVNTGNGLVIITY